MAKKLKIYNGSSWEDVTFAITPPSTNVTNSFTTNQVIDASTSVAALRVTQRGSGEAFRVEDETNPDSSSFVITSTGNVGIGMNNPIFKIQTSNTLGSSVGSEALVYQFNVDNGNQDYLKLYQERTSATTSWNGSDWILRRQVDGSAMGGFRWASGDWNVRSIYGIPGAPSVRTTHIGTSAPTGGIDGDVWLVYTA